MANVLEFALGLEASNFLREIGASSKEIISFAALMEGLRFAAEKTWSAMERGAALGDLSARTGESVGNLYKLQEALKQVGISADAAGPMILRMRKALSGVNEMGGNTDSIFAALGMDRKSLAAEDPLTAIQMISDALARLNANDATGAANGLFGREAAGDMLQIARQADDFIATLHESGQEAALFARNAANFKAVGDEMEKIKSHVEGFWAGLASGLAPEITKIEEYIAKINFTKFGTRLGDELALVFKSVDLGQFGSYFTLVLQAGVQEMSNSMMNEITKWYNAMTGQSKDAEGKGFWSKLGAGTLGVGQGLLGILDSVGGLAVPSLNEYAQKRFVQAQSNFDYSGLGDGVMATFADAINRGMNGLPNVYADKLAEMRKGFQAAVDKDQQNSPETQGGGIANAFSTGKYDIEPTALEKIGLVFGSGPGTGPDLQAQTAANTSDMKTLLADIAGSIAGLPGAIAAATAAKNF